MKLPCTTPLIYLTEVCTYIMCCELERVWKGRRLMTYIRTYSEFECVQLLLSDLYVIRRSTTFGL